MAMRAERPKEYSNTCIRRALYTLMRKPTFTKELETNARVCQKSTTLYGVNHAKKLADSYHECLARLIVSEVGHFANK